MHMRNGKQPSDKTLPFDLTVTHDGKTLRTGVIHSSDACQRVDLALEYNITDLTQQHHLLK
jgi:hypothetical protein